MDNARQSHRINPTGDRVEAVWPAVSAAGAVADSAWPVIAALRRIALGKADVHPAANAASLGD